MPPYRAPSKITKAVCASACITHIACVTSDVPTAEISMMAIFSSGWRGILTAARAGVFITLTLSLSVLHAQDARRGVIMPTGAPHDGSCRWRTNTAWWSRRKRWLRKSAADILARGGNADRRRGGDRLCDGRHLSARRQYRRRRFHGDPFRRTPRRHRDRLSRDRAGRDHARYLSRCRRQARHREVAQLRASASACPARSQALRWRWRNTAPAISRWRDPAATRDRAGARRLRGHRRHGRLGLPDM